MQIRPVGAEFLHADGRTDMTKLIVAFRNFANVPKIEPKNQVTKTKDAIHRNIWDIRTCFRVSAGHRNVLHRTYL
jgi:hypothetical protein